MDQISIKTPNPKCRLCWCLIESCRSQQAHYNLATYLLNLATHLSVTFSHHEKNAQPSSTSKETVHDLYYTIYVFSKQIRNLYVTFCKISICQLKIYNFQRNIKAASDSVSSCQHQQQTQQSLSNNSSSSINMDCRLDIHNHILPRDWPDLKQVSCI
jgi:hypothetical protein